MIVQFHLSHETRVMNTAEDIPEHDFYVHGGNVVKSEKADFLDVHDEVPDNVHFGKHGNPDVEIEGSDPDIHLLNNRNKRPRADAFNVYTTEHTLADTPPEPDHSWLLIRGGVDTGLFHGANRQGEGPVITATNNIDNRPHAADQDVHAALREAALADAFEYDAYGRKNPGGFLSHTELAATMTQAGVYANIAKTIPPNAVYEALSTGLPIVSVPGYGARDAVTHGYNGYIAETAGGFCARVEELLADPKLAREMGERSRKIALGRYGRKEFAWRWRAAISAVGRG